ncbi:GNAT family N-acetyltransferase [soil metagenome]
MSIPEITTERLLLRGWRESDLAPFAELNADPETMEHFPSAMNRVESDQMVERLLQGWADDGMSWWAVETLADGSFVGAVGLMRVSFDAPFAEPGRPATEVGWRLLRSTWGHGYATEAAVAAVTWGFEEHDLDQIFAFTVPPNLRSRRVMERLGMAHDPAEDFDHPRVDGGSPLRRHVLYRLPRPR